MLDDTCTSLLKQIASISTMVNTFHSDRESDMSRREASLQQDYEYYNFTGVTLKLVLTSGICVEVPPCEVKVPERHFGHFIVSEQLTTAERKLAKMSFPKAASGLPIETATKDFVDSSDHITNHVPAVSKIYHKISLNDIDKFNGIILPHNRATIHRDVPGGIYTNKAMRNTFTGEESKSGAGLQFSFVSKDKNNNLYIVFANEIFQMQSVQRDVSEDYIEIYRTLPNGKVVVEPSVLLKDAMENGILGTRVFHQESEAIRFKEDLVDAVDKRNTILTELRKTKEALRSEKDAHSATKRKALEDDSRTKATLWTKVSAVFTSIGSLVSSLWGSFRALF